ncbi:MAG TPA: DUF3300 domain-containing protein [Stellaceae bacterium]|nr:DUF3300 domain-containing protein [Stellaceae bacterium]
MTSFRLRVLAQTLPFLLIAPAVALAQTPPSRAEANAAMHATANPGAAHFTRQQLDQMVAPIALYPDQLLSQVLMAATYPQQVLDAAQWLDDPSHSSLKGDELAQALEPLPWDPSVKSLVAFPQIIKMMAEHIEWTQALGTAFASNEAEVMTRIQALRHIAMKSGKLKTVKHLKVREEGSEVVITEEEPDRIYVPVYNPVVVYGNDWPDRDFAPVYLPPPQGFVAETIEPGIEVSIGYSVVRPLWGWSRPDWREHRITVERSEYTRITRNAQISTDNVWHHSGPVVSVQNLPHRGSGSAQVPAGTIAPSAVAHQGEAARTGSTAPSNTATTPDKNQANQPAQNSTTAAPGKRESTTNSSERRQTTPQPGQASGTTNEPANSRTNAARPNSSEPGNAARQEEWRREREGARQEQGRREREGAGQEQWRGGREGAGQDQRREHEGAGRGFEHRAPGENEMQRDRGASGSSQEQERGREHGQRNQGQPEQNRPSAAQTPSAPPAAAPNPQAERRGPQHEQGAAPAPKQAERPNQPPAQGSSTPPAAAAPQPPKGGAQPGGHEKPRGEDEQKKEH